MSTLSNLSKWSSSVPTKASSSTARVSSSSVGRYDHTISSAASLSEQRHLHPEVRFANTSQPEQPSSPTSTCANYLAMLAETASASSAGDFEHLAGYLEPDSLPPGWHDEDDGVGPYYLTSPSECGTGTSISPIDTQLLSPFSDVIQLHGFDFDQALAQVRAESRPVHAAGVASRLPPTDPMWAFSSSGSTFESELFSLNKKRRTVAPPAVLIPFEEAVPTAKQEPQRAYIPRTPSTQRRVRPPPVLQPSLRRPSTASRRKRAHSQAFTDDEEEETPPPPPTASAEEITLWQRQANKLAQRRSRRRKAAHLQELNHQLEWLPTELMKWKERARCARSLLRGRGIDLTFDDGENKDLDELHLAV
ncbi:hypothetical protein K438DRAFT_1797598 [Mycena galopus ATCC 62051]|nr:hypothetical protein K438DRAFT_1797598 [Mycena galopus ATCC 62051]